LLDDESRSTILAKSARDRDAVAISAVTGEGIDVLLERLNDVLHETSRVHEITLATSDGKRLAWLYGHGDVVSRTDDDEAIVLQVRLSPDMLARFNALQK
jgi:GTPase